MGPEMVVIGWFASAIISRLMTMVFDYIEDQRNWQGGMKDEIKRLEKALPMIQAVVEFAEEVQIKDGNLKGELKNWLWRLKNAVDQAEDVLDELEYHHLKEEVGSGNSNKVRTNASRLKKIMIRATKSDPTLKGLKETVEGLDLVAADVGTFLKLVDDMKGQQQSSMIKSRITTSFLTVEEVFGRDEERDAVINRLTDRLYESSRRSIPILPIIGAGGVGKTTLAQDVYSHKDIKAYFDLRMWICLSSSFDVATFTAKMIESASRQRPNVENLDTLQEILQETLMSKKFLLVLDDVWNDKDGDSLKKLLAPLRSGQRGSKVLFTTRSTKVVHMMTGMMVPIHLKGLKKEPYWSLFKECAFGDEDPDHHLKLQSIGREIVKKLDGSPLAARTVGGVLRCRFDDSHWKRILVEDILDIKQGEDGILPVLKLSYQHLPAHLRPCFAFCSIFPKNYEFTKDELVHMWIAAGFVHKPNNSAERWEDVAESYFDELVERYIFERPTKYWFDNHESHYVMQNLLHDLARSVSAGECFRLEGNVPANIPETVRHLSVKANSLAVLEKVSGLKSLRTLLLSFDGHGREFNSTLKKMLAALTKLRLLDLSGCRIETLPDNVGNLIHLRHLNLRNTGVWELPKSSFKLYHLQVLIMPSDPIIDTLQKQVHLCNFHEELESLINLRHLICHSSVISSMPGIGKLTSLQELNYFCVKKCEGHKMAELEDMTELRELHIKHLDDVESCEQAIQAKISQKPQLKRLWLEWGDKKASGAWSVDPQLDEEVLDGLQPNAELKELTIKNYMGYRPPFWIEGLHVSNLASLCLEGCSGWKQLPPLGQLKFLKVLHLRNMLGVRRIDDHFYGGSDAFQSLEELSFSSMPEWEGWLGGAEDGNWFPRLNTLKIADCSMLRGLPPLPPGLKDLNVRNVGLVSLPVLWGCNDAEMSLLWGWNDAEVSPYNSSCSGSSSLISFYICDCQELRSLDQGLLRHQHHLMSLKRLSIQDCRKLVRLPMEGFQGLVCLKELDISRCPELQVPGMIENLLPPSLVELTLETCGDLDTSLPRLLQGLTSLSLLHLRRSYMTSPPSVAAMWGGLAALEELLIYNCTSLASLEGLEALASLKSLTIQRCSKLVAAASSLLASSATTSDQRVRKSVLTALHIDHPSLLQLPPLNGLILTQVLTITDCRLTSLSIPEQWLLRNRTSLQELHLFRLKSLQALPANLKRLSVLRVLTLRGVRELTSLPALPSSLKRLDIYNCHPTLEERYRKGVGLDWHKISYITSINIRK